MSDGRLLDPELETLFEDPELLRTASLLQMVPHASVEPEPAFRSSLRRRLMQEAWQRTEAAQPKPSWWRRLLTPPAMAWSGATVGVLLIAFVVFTLATNPGGGTEQVTVTSPLANAHQVALVQPISLSFSQPMNHRSVEQSVQIDPATKVTYEWQGNTLKLNPVNGLAPSTQYHVTVASGARTASGQEVGAQTPVNFTTAPPAPKPTPTPTATPTPAAPPVSGERRLAPAAGLPAAWSPDGATLYVIGPNGQLQAVSAAGGPVRTVAPDGVTVAAAGPEAVAYGRAGDLVYGQSLLKGAQPLAIGFRAGRLVYVSGNQVQGSDRSALTTLAATPQSALFSPAGDRLAYLAGGGLHLVTLGSGRDAQAPAVKDTAIGPATTLGAWSPDGRRLAYLSGGTVLVTDGAAPPSQLTPAQGVTGISWSGAGQLLLSGTAGLQMVGAEGSGLTTLAQGVFLQPQWAPGGGDFAFKRSNSLWVAHVAGARPSPAQPSQEDVVNAFLTARQKGQRDVALQYLDGPGLDAAGKLSLLYQSPQSLAGYHLLLSQPGHATARLVIAQGTVQSAVDESLTVVRDPNGKPVIHDLSDSPPRPIVGGPEVVGVSVAGNQVKVTFDSDLDPNTLGGISINGVQTQAVYDAPSRTVTLTSPGGLTPGAPYQLLVGGDLRDVNARPAPDLALAFTGPAPA